MDLREVLELDLEPRSVGVARAFVSEWLIAHRLESLTDTVVLLCSELVTNVVLHAAGPARLRLLEQGAGVRVEVSDASTVGPAPRGASVSATTGRGLQLLEDLADSWGCDRTPSGKTVWFAASTEHDPWASFARPDWLAADDSPADSPAGAAFAKEVGT